MKRTVIFDLGNVLFHFHPSHLTKAAIGSHPSAKEIEEAVFDRVVWDKLDAGQIDEGEAKCEICSRLPEALHEAARHVFDGWIENMPPVEGMEELLSDLSRDGRKLLLISNISLDFVRGYSSIPALARMLSWFEKRYFSASLRLVKPDPAIFHHVIRDNALDPADCIFIDDSALNIAGCESVGIEGYFFDGDVEKLRSHLFHK